MRGFFSNRTPSSGLALTLINLDSSPAVSLRNADAPETTHLGLGLGGATLSGLLNWRINRFDSARSKLTHCYNCGVPVNTDAVLRDRLLHPTSFLLFC